MKNKKTGFNLIEMVIVVAIIAVLLLIMVPLAQGMIINAQSTTCHANQTALVNAAKANIGKAIINNESYEPLAIAKATAEENGFTAVIEGAVVTVTGACPSDGVFTIYYDTEFHSFCSKHDDQSDAIYPTDVAISLFVKMLAKDDAAALLTKYFTNDDYIKNRATHVSIDSTAPAAIRSNSTTTAGQLMKLFTSAGSSAVGDMIPGGIKSWRLQRGSTYPNYQVYATSTDISTLKAGTDRVEVYIYDTATKAITKHVYGVKRYSDGTTSYNMIDTSKAYDQ